MNAAVFPDVQIPLIDDAPPLRWGIIGTGQIAGDFSDALHAHTAQRVTAVTSRSSHRGATFAHQHGIESVFTDAHAMAAHPAVDIVYIATPHRQHHASAMAAIEAGTPVLIEKPLGLNAAEVRAIAAAARKAGVFAAEGIWTRYQPAFHVVEELMWRGALGNIRLADAAVGWKVDPAMPGRMFNPVEGGALLDMGVYALWFAQFAIGRPTSIVTAGSMAHGVDVASTTTLRGRDAAIATATTTMLATTDGQASITGTSGSIRFLDHFVFPSRFSLTVEGSTTVWDDGRPLRGRAGLAYEASAVASYVKDGKTESPLHSLDDSLALATTMDTIRAALTEQDQAP